jgi:hypothetical protein
VLIRKKIGRRTTRDKWDGVIMEATRRRKSLGIFKNIFVFGEEQLDVGMNHG